MTGPRRSDGPQGSTRIASWNVNGLRACAKKGFARWLSRCGAEIVAVQEVRAFPDQLPDALARPRRWHACFQPAERPGYSGVAIFSRRAPDAVEPLGMDRFDVEGRVQIARFGRLVLVNGYFPKGSGRDRDNSRVPYKLDFYRALFDRVQRLRRGGKRVVVVGDWNTAHREIDLARPKQNVENSGFLPEERAEVDRWLAAGWIDAFRRLHPDEGGHYTWWSQRFGMRAKNVGWRIDYALVSPSAMKFVTGAAIHAKVKGSDHCPITLELDAGVLG